MTDVPTADTIAQNLRHASQTSHSKDDTHVRQDSARGKWKDATARSRQLQAIFTVFLWLPPATKPAIIGDMSMRYDARDYDDLGTDV